MAAFAILDFIFFCNICLKIHSSAYFNVDMQNLVKIARSAVKLLGIFDFQTGGLPPSLIWYDVIADHPRFVFDDPNVLLKLHVDRVYTLKISRFPSSARLA